MLDEIKEVEAYLCQPDAKEPRLGEKLLFEKKGEYRLNGIADVLTLVACRYLYDYNQLSKTDMKWKENVILIMRIWCGFENDVTEEELEWAKKENAAWFQNYPQAEGWLRKYHKNIHKEADVECEWLKYSEKWREILNSKYFYQAESLCYENILAQAIARGPLKSYYLVIKKEYENALENDIKNEKDKKPDSRRKNTLLKILAAYKILQRFHPGQESVLLQTNRILNWLGFNSDKDDRWCLGFQWCGENIFTKESTNNYKKLHVNQKFLKEMDVKLQEGDLIPDGYNVYKDMGHGKQNGLMKLS